MEEKRNDQPQDMHPIFDPESELWDQDPGTEEGFASWTDAFKGKRGEKALIKAYARANDFRDLVYELPGRPPFMLARDLAAVYQVQTKQLMKQLRRNREYFDDELAFELTWEEVEKLRFQYGTLQNARFTHRPWGFTHAGANHMAHFLHSEVAIYRSKQISKAFAYFEQAHRKSLTPNPAAIAEARTEGVAIGLRVIGIAAQAKVPLHQLTRLCWFRRHGLTQKEAGAALGISRGKVQQIERGLRKIGIHFDPVITNHRDREIMDRIGQVLLDGGGTAALQKACPTVRRGGEA